MAARASTFLGRLALLAKFFPTLSKALTYEGPTVYFAILTRTKYRWY